MVNRKSNKETRAEKDRVECQLSTSPFFALLFTNRIPEQGNRWISDSVKGSGQIERLFTVTFYSRYVFKVSMDFNFTSPCPCFVLPPCSTGS